MFLFEVKRLIWSALEVEFFELYFLLPVLSGHLAIPRGWPLNTGSTVIAKKSCLLYPMPTSPVGCLDLLMSVVSRIFRYHAAISLRNGKKLWFLPETGVGWLSDHVILIIFLDSLYIRY